MKTLILSLVAVFSGLQFFAQGCNELFISEYIEGWSNNKAIELYNPTDAPIDLSGYRLERYSNGATSAADNQKLDLSGTIQPGAAFVIVIDKQDPDGTGQEAPVWDELAEVADAFECPIYDENNAMYFNGNDAMVLRKIDGNVVIDVFGTIGEDPGNPSDGGGWNNVGPSYNWATNGEASWTANNTLVRKFDVTMGDATPTDPFNVGLEWDSLPANTFDNLGFHDCACSPNNIETTEAPDTFDVFPNPSQDGRVYLQGVLNATELRVMTADGKLVETRTAFTEDRVRLDLTAHGQGLYVLQLTTANGAVHTERVLVR